VHLATPVAGPSGVSPELLDVEQFELSVSHFVAVGSQAAVWRGWGVWRRREWLDTVTSMGEIAPSSME